MGFDEARAYRTLKYFRNNIRLATEHLLMNNSVEMDDRIFVDMQDS